MSVWSTIFGESRDDEGVTWIPSWSETELQLKGLQGHDIRDANMKKPPLL